MTLIHHAYPLTARRIHQNRDDNFHCLLSANRNYYATLGSFPVLKTVRVILCSVPL